MANILLETSGNKLKNRFFHVYVTWFAGHKFCIVINIKNIKKEVIMATRSLTRAREMYPSVFDDDFFRPWNQLLGSSLLSGRREMSTPAVNIDENKHNYTLSIAAPGLKKDDFNIEIEGNTISISCEKEETTEEEDSRHVSKEYNYSSFCRSFTLPENVNQDKIDARYEDGVLKLTLPKKEEAKKADMSKHITVQ
jgi:HSP20 family protein